MPASRSEPGDRILWLGAGTVVLMAMIWLIVSAPWSRPSAITEPVLPAELAPISVRAEQAAMGSGAVGASDPLTMAQMAFEAGMLVEPAEYNAWSLFREILERDPAAEAARDGLNRVAAGLVQRGQAALEQGRYDDALEMAATIRAALPNHAGARALVQSVEIATAPVLAMPPPPPAPVQADPIPELHAAFRGALSSNAILRPAGSSAVDIVSAMLALAPEHELSVAARDLLVTEMLDRSRQSIEALDPAAARTWIESAAALTVDTDRVELARRRLTQFLIEAETRKVIPAAELRPLNMAAPEFPRPALTRGIEGWVEVRFVVTTAGDTADITVIDASHERYFRDEAVAAVDEWRFEPFVFMNRAIPKTSVARVEFVLD